MNTTLLYIAAAAFFIGFSIYVYFSVKSGIKGLREKISRAETTRQRSHTAFIAARNQRARK